MSAAAAFSCLAGQALPALRCGGDARSRPAAEAAWGRPFHPTEFKGAPLKELALPNALCPGLGVALSTTFWMTACRERGKRTRSALLALPGLGSAPGWPTLGNQSPRTELGVRQSRRGLGKNPQYWVQVQDYAGTLHLELL